MKLPHEPRTSFSPIEAAYAVAQYMPADPAVWLERCALAGIQVSVTSDRRLCLIYSFGPNLEYQAESDQTQFLGSWLNLTPGGTKAVVEYLSQRARA